MQWKFDAAIGFLKMFDKVLKGEIDTQEPKADVMYTDCWHFDQYDDFNASIPYCKLKDVGKALSCDKCNKYVKRTAVMEYVKRHIDEIRSGKA